MKNKEKPQRRFPTFHSEIKVRRTGATEKRSLEDLFVPPPSSSTRAPRAVVLLDETTVVVPHDQALIVKRGQWLRLKMRITEFGTATNDWSSAAWAFVGIAAAAALAIFTPNRAVLIAAVVSGSVAAVLCFAIGHQLHKTRKSQGQDIVNEMDTIAGA